jgi:hypothetical protein
MEILQNQIQLPVILVFRMDCLLKTILIQTVLQKNWKSLLNLNFSVQSFVPHCLLLVLSGGHCIVCHVLYRLTAYDSLARALETMYFHAHYLFILIIEKLWIIYPVFISKLTNKHTSMCAVNLKSMSFEIHNSFFQNKTKIILSVPCYNSEG